MSKPPSKSVFVGNIPYGKQSFEVVLLEAATDRTTGLTEEQIIRIFSTAGKVLNFRLVYDRETGRPKGFGFVEFPDSGSSTPVTSRADKWANFPFKDSAASAVRNLNDHEIMNRKLRVDFSNDGGDDDSVCTTLVLA